MTEFQIKEKLLNYGKKTYPSMQKAWVAHVNSYKTYSKMENDIILDFQKYVLEGAISIDSDSDVGVVPTLNKLM